MCRALCLAAFSLTAGCAARSGSHDAGGADAGVDAPRVLVFSKTMGFRHSSIPSGIAAFNALGADAGFTVTATEDSSALTNLADIDIVIFLNTTGDVLDPAQQDSLQAFVEAGGGWLGVHSAADTESDWPFYGTLVGARFDNHPAIQQATVHVEDAAHLAAQGIPSRWVRTDEWYNFRSNPRGNAHVVLTLDETTYSGGTHGADHPVAWAQRIGRGRTFYTELGHTEESYADPVYVAHLFGALRWVSGRTP